MLKTYLTKIKNFASNNILAPLNNLFLQENSYFYVTEVDSFQRKLRKCYLERSNWKWNNGRECIWDRASCNKGDYHSYNQQMMLHKLTLPVLMTIYFCLHLHFAAHLASLSEWHAKKTALVISRLVHNSQTLKHRLEEKQTQPPGVFWPGVDAFCSKSIIRHFKGKDKAILKKKFPQFLRGFWFF